MYKRALPRFCQYAVRVWGCELEFDHPERTAEAGIEATRAFFRSLGMPLTLGELGIGADALERMAEKCTNDGGRTLPGWITYGKQEILEIYRLCL